MVLRHWLFDFFVIPRNSTKCWKTSNEFFHILRNFTKCWKTSFFIFREISRNVKKWLFSYFVKFHKIKIHEMLKNGFLHISWIHKIDILMKSRHRYFACQYTVKKIDIEGPRPQIWPRPKMPRPKIMPRPPISILLTV